MLTLKKRILITMLVILFISTVTPVQAKSNSMNATEIRKQEQIDTLFTEINSQISSEKNIQYLKSMGIDVNMDENVDIKSDISQIELQLSKLGVKKIDPNNPSDMLLLKELLINDGEQYIESSNDNQLSSIPDPPDLNAFASVYSLYHYSGSYTVGDTTYNYSYIRVIDDKGYDKLYKNAEFDAAPKNASQSVVQAVLAYTFSYAFSTLISNNPIGIAVNWLLGAVFSGLDAYNSANIAGGSDPMYRVFGHSVTSHTYYYIYHINSWKFMGTSGEFSFERSGIMLFNYNGQPKTEYATIQNWTSRTPWVWHNFVTAFHNSVNKNNFRVIQEFGSFKINGYNNTSFTFTPVHVSLPGYLM